eukprot:6460964-Amphidinium_carterae.1
MQPPWRLVALLHDDEEVRNHTLLECKVWFEVLRELEESARTKTVSRAWLASLGWSKEHFSRWLLFALSEYDFKLVPAH